MSRGSFDVPCGRAPTAPAAPAGQYFTFYFVIISKSITLYSSYTGKIYTDDSLQFYKLLHLPLPWYIHLKLLWRLAFSISAMPVSLLSHRSFTL